MAQLFVNNPGNLSDNIRRAKLDKMVAEMEMLPSAFGTPGTNYFLRDFVLFEEFFQNTIEEEEPQNKIEEKINHLNTTTLSTLIEPVTINTKSMLNSFIINKIKNQTNTKKNKSIVLKAKRETNFDTLIINIEKNLPSFLAWPEYAHWAPYIKYSNKTNKQNEINDISLNKFMITVGYHGSDLKDW